MPLRRRVSMSPLVVLVTVLSLLAQAAPPARAQGGGGDTAQPPDGAFVSLQQALATALRHERPGLQAEGDDDYWSSSLPASPPVRTYAVDNSFGSYGNRPKWPGQQDIDNGIKALGTAPVNPGQPGSAGGAGQQQSGGALPGSAQVDPAVLAAALRQADQAQSYALSVLNNVNGGNWNQFLGRPTFPTTWGVAFQDPLSAGAGTTVPAPTTANVLGFAAPQPTDYAPPLLRRLNYLLYAPWTDTTITPRTTLDARYQQLEQQQLARFFTDPNLSGMRAEANKVLLYYIYTDPYYMFWSYEYSVVLGRIRETRPAYATLRRLAQTIAAWQPTQDEATLRERYETRLEYKVTSAQVEVEVLFFLAANPALANDLGAVQLWLNQRLLLVLTQPSVTLWYANWLQRWNTFAFTSETAQAEQRQLKTILSEHPAFEEYTRLNGEVVQLLPSYGGLATTQRVASLGAAVQTSPAVAAAIQGHYATYRSRISELVRASQLAVALEQFYGSLNELATSDPAYRELSTVQIQAARDLAAYQRDLHDTILLGYRANGPLYNAYLDPAVVVRLTDASTRELALRAGDFYEDYNRYWFGLFAGQSYKGLEEQARAQILNALSRLEPQLKAVRDELTASINRIPLVSQLRQAQTELVAQMRGEGHSPSSLPIGDPTPELRSRLDRMAELAQELNRLPAPTTANLRPRLYLPLVRH